MYLNLNHCVWPYQWLSAKLWYLHCINAGDTSLALNYWYEFISRIFLQLLVCTICVLFSSYPQIKTLWKAKRCQQCDVTGVSLTNNNSSSNNSPGMLDIYITRENILSCRSDSYYVQYSSVIWLNVSIQLRFSYWSLHIDGLVQDCSISIAITLELLQSCTKPSKSELPPLSV